MKKKDIPNPRCQGQPCYLVNTESTPMQAGSHTLKPGQRACHGKDHWYTFTSRDPRSSVPSWCPRLRHQPHWRIYSYTPEYQRIYEEHYRGVKALDNPYESWYALHQNGKTRRTAREFWRGIYQCHINVELLLDAEPMQAGELLVIDDGITPRAFYMSDTGLRPVEVNSDSLPEPEEP